MAIAWSAVVALTALGSVLLTSWQVGWLTVAQGLAVTLTVLLLALILIAAGLGAMVLFGSVTPARLYQPPTQHTDADPARDSQMSQQRDSLVKTCIGIGDGVDNPAVRERLTRALAEVGVLAVHPDGELFDPARHRAVDRVPAADPALHNRVASTERLGYLDHGLLLRPADVTVYQVGP
ncbi:MAG: nucleotide exchange factor GrpE [Actinomycetota bacterium]|nr:nucleotide exchange factor GrpE [Actinomycetota bacterium]